MPLPLEFFFDSPAGFFGSALERADSFSDAALITGLECKNNTQVCVVITNRIEYNVMYMVVIEMQCEGGGDARYWHRDY